MKKEKEEVKEVLKVGDFVKTDTGQKGEIVSFDTKGINTCATLKDRTRWLITRLTKIKQR